MPAMMPIQPQMLGAGCQLAVQDIKGPASYTTGGVKYSAQTWGLMQLIFLECADFSQSGNYSPHAVSIPGPGKTSVTIKWYTAAGAEVTNATNLSAETCRVLALGM
jgi:hypothetical protein